VARHPHEELSRREREIMDVLYRLGSATAAEICEHLEGGRNYSTVRAQLRTLEEKGRVRHEEEGLRYVYFPTVAPEQARRTALEHLRETFFEGSVEKVVAALLGDRGSRIKTEELDRLERLIQEAKRHNKTEERSTR
jgi:predicted transcriptional regulator